MKFTTPGFKLVEYEGRNGPVFTRVGGGLEFTVDRSKDAVPIDMGGRTVNKDIYDKYYAPPKAEKPKEEE